MPVSQADLMDVSSILEKTANISESCDTNILAKTRVVKIEYDPEILSRISFGSSD
jgi:hypothetical protein